MAEHTASTGGVPSKDGVAYEVTATRKRPKTFDELAGQEFVVSTLKNSLKNGSIAHAYLFSGPRGCGKTSAARILARALNCEQSKDGVPSLDGASRLAENPCGVCDNCTSIAAGASMDVIEIDGASNTSVNDVRQIKDEVLFPPQTGRYKIYIIDEVHMLSNSAFNALLKTIEEPPPYIIFIFATTEIHKVPATIKSRCQQFNFRLIPIETIQALLQDLCTEMGLEAEEGALFWIARESTGSLRDAYTLFDQVASFAGGHISESLIREKLGLAGLEKINALAEACAANDVTAAFSQTDALLASGIAIEQLIIDLAGYYRSLLLFKNGITRESLLGCRLDQFSLQVLDSLDSVRLEQALDILLACYRNIKYSLSPRFELETAISKLSWLSHWVSPTELKAALDGAQYTLNNCTLPVGSSGKAAPPAQSINKPIIQHSSAAEQSIANECRRILTGKAEAPKAVNETEDEDEPAWSGILRKSEAAKPQSREAHGEESPGEESPLDRVLRIIPGTVITK